MIMPTKEQLFRQWEIDHEFGKINDRGSEHNPISSHACSFCNGYGSVRVAGKLRKCVVCDGKGFIDN